MACGAKQKLSVSMHGWAKNVLCSTMAVQSHTVKVMGACSGALSEHSHAPQGAESSIVSKQGGSAQRCSWLKYVPAIRHAVQAALPMLSYCCALMHPHHRAYSPIPDRSKCAMSQIKRSRSRCQSEYAGWCSCTAFGGSTTSPAEEVVLLTLRKNALLKGSLHAQTLYLTY